jgi:hypothetical protein
MIFWDITCPPGQMPRTWPFPAYHFVPVEIHAGPNSVATGAEPWTSIEVPPGSRLVVTDDPERGPGYELDLELPDGTRIDAEDAFRAFGDGKLVEREGVLAWLAVECEGRLKGPEPELTWGFGGSVEI